MMKYLIALFASISRKAELVIALTCYYALLLRGNKILTIAY